MPEDSAPQWRFVAARARWFAIAVVLVGASLLPPAVAIAGGAVAASQKPWPGGAFALKASNGYSVYVIGPGVVNSNTTLYFEDAEQHSVVVYSVPSEVTKKGIWASFGTLGRVAMRFHPSREVEKVRGCGGSSRPIRPGSYAGTIRFRGEEGFSTVQAHRAKSDLRSILPRLCSTARGEWSGPPGAALRVERTQPGRPAVAFEAVKNSTNGLARLDAGIRERHGKVSVVRGVGLIAGPGVFTYGRERYMATIAPPPPFSGRADFLEERPPGTPSRLSGNLRVDFPGRAGVALAGTGFHGELQMRGNREVSPFEEGPDYRSALAHLALPRLVP